MLLGGIFGNILAEKYFEMRGTLPGSIFDYGSLAAQDVMQAERAKDCRFRRKI